MKLAVGIPWQQEMMWSSFLFNFWQTDIPKSARLIRGTSRSTPGSRNAIVQEALAWGADELLFMDIDQGFPPDLLARLRSHDKEIVSGWSPQRKQPHFPLVYKREGEQYRPLLPEGQLQKVDGFGFGCVLVKAEVFKNVSQPWFEQEYHESGGDDTGKLKVGHDLYFCRKAQDAGYDLWVDNTVECTHMFNAMIDKEYAMANYRHMMAEHVIKERMNRRIVLA